MAFGGVPPLHPLVALPVSDCPGNNFSPLFSFKGAGALPRRNGNVGRCKDAAHCNSWELSLNQHIPGFCKSPDLLLQKNSNLSRLFDCK